MVKKQNAGDMMSVFLNESAKQSSPDATEQTATNTGAKPTPIRKKKERKTEHLQVLLRPSVKEALRKESEATGESMNELMNSILEEKLIERR